MRTNSIGQHKLAPCSKELRVAVSGNNFHVVLYKTVEGTKTQFWILIALYCVCGMGLFMALLMQWNRKTSFVGYLAVVQERLSVFVLVAEHCEGLAQSFGFSESHNVVQGLRVSSGRSFENMFSFFIVIRDIVKDSSWELVQHQEWMK